jgi:hypothetical protein
MSYIVIQTPWSCGYNDCLAGWHRATYWDAHPEGYTVDNYSDGDREGCAEGDLPSHDEASAAWEGYRQHVAATGEDPLCEYIVSYAYKRKARFVAEFRNGIGGAVLCRWKRGRGAWSFGAPPDLLMGYLGTLSDFGPEPSFRRWMLKDHDPKTGKRESYTFAEMLSLAEADDNVRVTKPERRFVRMHLLLEETVPRKAEAVARELRRAAKWTEEG